MSVEEIQTWMRGQLAAKGIVVGAPFRRAAVEEVWRDIMLKTEPVVTIDECRVVDNQLTIT